MYSTEDSKWKYLTLLSAVDSKLDCLVLVILARYEFFPDWLGTPTEFTRVYFCKYNW